MYAVIELKGSQIRVEEGDKIVVNRIKEQKSKALKVDKVLFGKKGNSYLVGEPYVKDAYVDCEIIGDKRGKKIKAPTGKEIRKARDSGDYALYTSLKKRASDIRSANIISGRGVGVDSGKLAKTYRNGRLIKFRRRGATFGEQIDNLESNGHKYARTFSNGRAGQPARPLNELADPRDVNAFMKLVADRIMADFGKKI